MEASVKQSYVVSHFGVSGKDTVLGGCGVRLMERLAMISDASTDFSHSVMMLSCVTAGGQ